MSMSKPKVVVPRSSKRNVEKHPDGGDHSTIPAYQRTTSTSPWHRGRTPAINKNTDVGVHKQAWWERFDPAIPADEEGERVISTMRKVASALEPDVRFQAAQALVKLAVDLDYEEGQLALAALQGVDHGDHRALRGIYDTFFAGNMEDSQ